MNVKMSESCPTLCDPMDCIVLGILQVRILEWVAFPFSRDLPNPGIGPRSLTLWASILWCSAFLQSNSHILLDYWTHMPTGETIALTRRTFVGKSVSLLSNMLSRYVTALLPRSKHLLTSWLTPCLQLAHSGLWDFSFSRIM